MTRTLEHEEVRIRRGPRSGLTLIVAVHSRTLGPAVGGCRMRRYADWRDGLADALRLSEAMTYKCAVSGVEFGGGKSVIVLDGDEHTEPAPELRAAALADMGEFIASFDGTYRGGPDVGTSPADMAVLRRSTPYVYCLPEEHGGTGDSGVPTSLGVLAALRAGAEHVFGTASFAGRTAVVSGFGSVGRRVAAGLAADGARVLVSDVDAARGEAALRAGYGRVAPEEALATPADILVPAAVGGVLTPGTADRLDVRLVVGPANNQLTDDTVADTLAARGIVWVPDFVASAGGVVYTLGREAGHLDHDSAVRRVEGIGDTVRLMLKGGNPLREAKALAAERLERLHPDREARTR
ncbi:Glu/Leu/Phe/Val dehydrogenase dimerization domain-containing protein [Streptomyces sp. S.PB5]|uniref:Glu/Leu/Phe/Val dehydrogenase dimerization domain-containing protein n=1 Tax=Streptomyces sp. S.PB5 TaxID=3020844 RepID=UPI0025B185F3|nr:Glu/Leu/Phe/Val dehydrogenase dimerization domain-containing protein [Streptomyces sp. S.PB5]MDN3021786.1 Glu/Leu/Phe/Val dehydrogenase dimerization domain-containing protein [Streptomyces sp. S.PB5]